MSEEHSALLRIITACDAALHSLGDMTQAQYLASPATQQAVVQQLTAACQALAWLNRYAPGLACHLSYRERTAAFYQYLIGDPALLKQDYVYDILRSKIPLLLLEARELEKHTSA